MLLRNNLPLLGRLHNITVAMTILIAAVMFIMTSCERKPVMAHARFVHLPLAGWHQGMPLTFLPEYDDSTLTYDITLAIRHEESYRYSNLALGVDVISADSTVNSRQIDMRLADGYGNWTGGGFGTLYQDKILIAGDVKPSEARSVVVWQSMQGCDTLRGLVNLGIIVTPR